MRLRTILACCVSLCIPFQSASSVTQDSSEAHRVLFDSLKFRCIGPFRGGRSAAVTGVRGNPMKYYMGSTGGGVWQSTDGGSSWENISDGFFGGSIGAVAVAPSDSNVIYAGGGEKTVRGNVSHGNGMWRSHDAGQTWTAIGLPDSRQIPRIRIHPNDPETVYAAVLGHLFGPNQQRGIFRSRNGGEDWEQVLFASEEAGAVDLIIDPNNPRVLYATTWKVLRTPYSLESGGEGSGIWKSTDGGDTWKDITRNSGLPEGTIGICGIAVSPVDSNRVWASVEAEEGGLFRSDDSGKNWTRINDERKLRQRAWYYSRIYAGPENIDEVYVLNVEFWRSTDGGNSFASIGTPHGDHHDLWIDPDDPKRMIIGDDGGAQVSYNGGQSWSTYLNQPTAQFYRVTADNHFPYRVYGAQQDNSTVRILHRSRGGSIVEQDWEPTAGGESGHIAPDPNDPEIVYGGSYGGYLTRYNHRTDEVRNIHIWPDNPLGHGAGDGKYRFQWNFPLFFSRHDPKTLYAAANVLFKTSDGGGSWTQISGDLTRNDPSKLGPSGGPITKDNTSVEYYCTIFAAAESLLEPNVIWAGTDDGLLQITRDGGQIWKNVTPPEMPEWTQINCVEPHPTEPGGLFVAGTKYKLDDFKPYLYKTTNYGETWTKIVSGIDPKHFTRVIRADAKKPGLLYAGTESGLYISFDDGQQWEPFQCNLPIVPITDLAIKDDDLLVATQGRSFWILDDLSRLHQWTDDVMPQPLKLFVPRPTYRIPGGAGQPSPTAGQNIAAGVHLYFWVKDKSIKESEATLTITDAQNVEVAVFKHQPDGGKKTDEPKVTEPDSNERKFNVNQGMNQLIWDLRVAGAKSFQDMVLWGDGLQGPLVVPGKYRARLAIGEQFDEIEFEIVRDPRSAASVDELKQQFEFLSGVRDKLSETHAAIDRIRDARSQINAMTKRIKDNKDHESIVELGSGIVEKMTAIEKNLYQTRNQSSQDPLNFPIQLNNRLSSLAGVAAMGDNAPTQQAIAVRDVLVQEIDAQLEQWVTILESDIAEFNRRIHAASIPAIIVDGE